MGPKAPYLFFEITEAEWPRQDGQGEAPPVGHAGIQGDSPGKILMAEYDYLATPLLVNLAILLHDVYLIQEFLLHQSEDSIPTHKRINLGRAKWQLTTSKKVCHEKGMAAIT